jgi:succinoglycan biosynthesis transport protein ExoP
VQQESEAFDIAQALRVVRRRALLVLFCAAVVAAAAFGFSKLQDKEYTATASLIFRSTPLSQQVAGISPPSSSSQFAQQTSNTALVGLGDMAAQTARHLHLSEEAVRDSISVAGQGESDIVAVSSTTTSAALSAKTATVYAREFVKQQQLVNRHFFASALALVDRQLEELPVGQRFGPAAVPLQNRAQALELLKGLKYDNVEIAQVALPPSSPSSPKTAQNTVLGLLLGLLLGVGLAFVLERLERDRRLGEPEDLEETYGLPLLGAVPASRGLARAGEARGSEPTSLSLEEAEAFQMIRGRLRFSPGGHDLRSVLVSSAERGNGTTTVARFLAEAAAMRGARVLLLEADLRTPVLANRLGLLPGPALPEVLGGIASMDAAIQSVNVGAAPGGPGERRKTLDVLACGLTPPANPGELLESHAMEIVLDRARSTYDLVVIDAPPPTALADALSLLGNFDGVVVVSWVGRSLRAQAERLHSTLRSSGAAQLGLIANGVRPGALGSYVGTSGQAATAGLPSEPASINGGPPSDAPVPAAGA